MPAYDALGGDTASKFEAAAINAGQAQSGQVYYSAEV
jgi:hypothetical protein